MTPNAAALRTELDHIVITAPTLAAGVEYVRSIFGVAPQPGGEHARMGTHNCLLKLGDAVYLEVIAINPHAAAPSRRRWFRMDDPDALRTPRLATWVARTNDIRAAPAALGDVMPMSRGDLHWRITVPADGGLPFDGVAPTLIQWETAAHPARTLADLGCTLVRLEGFHPAAEAISAMLRELGFHGDFSISVPPTGIDPHLIAHISTPAGIRRIRG
ncbi:MAG: VOC family protein [Sulfurifustis sp.]